MVGESVVDPLAGPGSQGGVGYSLAKRQELFGSLPASTLLAPVSSKGPGVVDGRFDTHNVELVDLGFG